MSHRDGSMPETAGDLAQSHSADEWSEAIARTIAHLAAQLTMSQIRLRALATEMSERGLVDDVAVARRTGQIAKQETGSYLRENLGDVLADLIDLDALESEIVAYLSS